MGGVFLKLKAISFLTGKLSFSIDQISVSKSQGNLLKAYLLWFNFRARSTAWHNEKSYSGTDRFVTARMCFPISVILLEDFYLYNKN